MKNVIIFDGDAIRTIDLDYFFQDKFIEDLDLEGVGEALVNNLVFNEAMDDIKDDVELNEDARNPEFRKKVNAGSNILKGMIMDMAGDKAGEIIINKIQNDLELCRV